MPAGLSTRLSRRAGLSRRDLNRRRRLAYRSSSEAREPSRVDRHRCEARVVDGDRRPNRWAGSGCRRSADVLRGRRPREATVPAPPPTVVAPWRRRQGTWSHQPQETRGTLPRGTFTDFWPSFDREDTSACTGHILMISPVVRPLARHLGCESRHASSPRACSWWLCCRLGPLAQHFRPHQRKAAGLSDDILIVHRSKPCSSSADV